MQAAGQVAAHTVEAQSAGLAVKSWEQEGTNTLSQCKRTVTSRVLQHTVAVLHMVALLRLWRNGVPIHGLVKAAAGSVPPRRLRNRRRETGVDSGSSRQQNAFNSLHTSQLVLACPLPSWGLS